MEEPVYSSLLEATHPVCHVFIVFLVSAPVFISLVGSSLAKEGIDRVPALFYKVIGRKNEKLKFRSVRFRPVLYKC